MNSSFMSTFKNPTSEYRGAPFWSWNGTMEPAELRRQIRLMRRMGLGGFFMHSRVGLATPYLGKQWFDAIRACVDEAKKLGMKAWLYDEDRWPSGAAGGIVTKNPRHRLKHLAMERITRTAAFRWTPETVAACIVTLNGDEEMTAMTRLPRGKRPPSRLAKGELLLSFHVGTDQPSSWFNDQTYLDTMSREAVQEFIRVTHESYRRNIGKDFGKTVPGIFTDEPNYGRVFATRPSRLLKNSTLNGQEIIIPWTGVLPATFRKRYGYDLIPVLTEIFYDHAGTSISRTRRDYFDCITHLFTDSFARQIGNWCGRNKLAFTGHVLQEETCTSQTMVVGAAMRFYEHMQAPGIDVLTEYNREYDTAKQVASVAHQFGKKWRVSETYGCTGWDFSFEGHKAISDWQAALGINIRCQHLWWYTMLGEAKRDYPAAISNQSPWWESYPKVEDYFARINTILTQGEEVRDLLVIHPIESQWAVNSLHFTKSKQKWDVDDILIRTRDALLTQHLDFDYGDESILARHARISRKDGVPVLTIGKADYKAVLVPPQLTIRSSTLAILKKFRNMGGTVAFASTPPGYVNAEPSQEAARLAETCLRVSERKPAEMARLLSRFCRRITVVDKEGKAAQAALCHLREDNDAFYLFMCNTGRNRITANRYEPLMSRDRNAVLPDVRVTAFAGCSDKPIELNPETGAVTGTNASRSGNAWEIRTDFPKLGSRIFVCRKNKSRTALPAPAVFRDRKTVPLQKRIWQFSMSEPNVLVLDRPAFKIDNGAWQKSCEILRADNQVRTVLGMRLRGGSMIQPWAARMQNSKPISGTVELSYSVNVQHVPAGDVLIGIEKPERFEISVNGHPLAMNNDSGWWCDPSLRTFHIDPACLHKGKNEIHMTCQYDNTFSGFEIVYLLGSFGTRVSGTDISMTCPPETLRIGDWTRQGLTFYSGNVAYRTGIAPELRKGERLFVKVPSYRGTAFRVLVDGKEAGVSGWAPNEVEITNHIKGGKSELAIEILGHRKNSHGPHHFARKWPSWTGPGQFASAGKDWLEGYQLVPCGIMEPPLLITRSTK